MHAHTHGLYVIIVYTLFVCVFVCLCVYVIMLCVCVCVYMCVHLSLTVCVCVCKIKFLMHSCLFQRADHVFILCWGYTSLCGMEQTRKTKHASCLACRASHNWPSSLTTSITTWVSHHPPWPLLLQRESHISHNTLSYLTSSITTWVSHFTQLTVIPDHLYYNVNLTFHTTHRHTWPLLLQRSLTFHTTRCHTLPLLLQCESHISHNWWVSHSHNSLSILTTSITTWVSHFTQREFLVSCESHISHNWPSHWPLWLQHESRITVIPDLFYCNMSGSLHAACRSANF